MTKVLASRNGEPAWKNAPERTRASQYPRPRMQCHYEQPTGFRHTLARMIGIEL